MKGLPLFPIYLSDFFGSLLMLVFSLVAYRWARRLRHSRPQNVLFMYLFGLSLALVALSVSRSAGHMLRFVFIYAGVPEWWRIMAPWSGGLNTMTFVAVGVLTFYYPNVRRALELVEEDARKLRQAHQELEKAHAELKELNRTLEERVRQRTHELIVSEQKFRRLFESSEDGVFFCDSQGCLSDINPSGVEMLGYKDKEEVIGRPMSDFFLEPEEWELYYQRLMREGYIKDFETRFRRADGSTIYVIISANAIECGRDGYGCEGLIKDITHFKKMTEKLIYSEKMASLGQLAAGIAHEINTPLGIILGYAQLLKEEFPENKELVEELDIIENQALICRKIVSDLLSFARSSDPRPEKELINVNDCIRHTVDMVKHTFEMDDIRIHLHLEEKIPPVFADQDRLNQVIVNLLNNSRDAIKKGGEIHLWTYFDETECLVIIEIGDTGCGIPPEVKDKIFDPFFTTKPPGQGTGLGLSVSYGIIEEHEGSIEVFSPPEGEKYKRLGIKTLFRIQLPVAR